jgi:hypothetical protein
MTFVDIIRRHRERNHRYGRDVPLWVGDALNMSFQTLFSFYRTLRFLVIFTVIAISIYDIYAVLNELPYVSLYAIQHTLPSLLVTAVYLTGFHVTFAKIPE